MALPPFIYVDTPKAWAACLNHLKRHDTVCIDLESNSLYVYKEEICLIQISAGGTDYIIDPKANLDLTGLGEIIRDPAVEKVFHASEYDLILLKRSASFGLPSTNCLYTASITPFRLTKKLVGYPHLLRNTSLMIFSLLGTVGNDMGCSSIKVKSSSLVLRQKLKTSSWSYVS